MDQAILSLFCTYEQNLDQRMDESNLGGPEESIHWQHGETVDKVIEGTIWYTLQKQGGGRWRMSQ